MMRLYSWVTSEKGVSKMQGGNKRLELTLDYEENGHPWYDCPANHELNILYILDEQDKPSLYIQGNKAFQIIDKR